jgi:hypothetical protein
LGTDIDAGADAGTNTAGFRALGDGGSSASDGGVGPFRNVECVGGGPLEGGVLDSTEAPAGAWCSGSRGAAMGRPGGGGRLLLRGSSSDLPPGDFGAEGGASPAGGGRRCGGGTLLERDADVSVANGGEGCALSPPACTLWAKDGSKFRGTAGVTLCIGGGIIVPVVVVVVADPGVTAGIETGGAREGSALLVTSGKMSLVRRKWFKSWPGMVGGGGPAGAGPRPPCPGKRFGAEKLCCGGGSCDRARLRSASVDGLLPGAALAPAAATDPGGAGLGAIFCCSFKSCSRRADIASSTFIVNVLGGSP